MQPRSQALLTSQDGRSWERNFYIVGRPLGMVLPRGILLVRLPIASCMSPHNILSGNKLEASMYQELRILRQARFGDKGKDRE